METRSRVRSLYLVLGDGSDEPGDALSHRLLLLSDQGGQAAGLDGGAVG